MKFPFVASALVLLIACSSSRTELQPFTSDGCTLFPKDSIISGTDWCDCCFEHDIAYWRGGTSAERLQADEQLRACVEEKTGNTSLANLMYEGVRFGGSPWFYTWYRWGYGWPLQRSYGPLTQEEQDLADNMLKSYLDENPNPLCGK